MGRSWNGVAILARGKRPHETQRGLPGDPDDAHSRYIEAAVGDILIGCLYLPNGNPSPGPKLEYKLGWFERQEGPVILAGDYNVMPTELDLLGYFRNAYGRDAGPRIDHLLLSPQVAPRLRAAGVDRHVRGWGHTSDHAPTWVELAPS